MSVQAPFASSATSAMISWIGKTCRFLWHSLNQPVLRYQLQQQMILPKLKGVSIRQYQSRDFEACVELCRVNAPYRFPPETLEQFEKLLREVPPYYLVVEHKGVIIACGGYVIHYLDFTTFIYGLVHPEYQSQGVGRALFFARVAQLPMIKGDTLIQICVVEKSLPYYQSLGFSEISEKWQDSLGEEHPMARLGVNAYLITCSQNYLKRADIPFPDLRRFQSPDLLFCKDALPEEELPKSEMS